MVGSLSDNSKYRYPGIGNILVSFVHYISRILSDNGNFSQKSCLIITVSCASFMWTIQFEVILHSALKHKFGIG